jgi:hypothetical protein
MNASPKMGTNDKTSTTTCSKHFWSIMRKQLETGNIKRYALRVDSKYYPGIWIFYGANDTAKKMIAHESPLGMFYDYA